VAPRHGDTEAIVASVVAGGRKLCVNYWPNFEAPALELRRLFESGVLGSAVHLESFYGYDLAGEYGMALKRDLNHWVHRLPGKLFQNVLDHVLNKIAPFLDDEQPLIQALAYRADDEADASSGEVLDELRVMLRGAHTSAYATFSAHARPVGHSLRVYGTKNTAHVDFMARTVVLERKATLPSAVGRLVPSFLTAKDYMRQGMKNVGRFSRSRFHYFDGMRTLLTDFYLSIERDTEPPIAYREILRVSAMMDEIFQQVYPEVRP
jgi:predicted dehydrogenase